MQRFKITIEYDGTPYCGWQRQNNVTGVQEVIEKAIYAFSNETVSIQAAGRTDAGVHARGQVAHFDLEKQRTPYQVMEGLNFHMRYEPVVITQCEQVSADFTARFSAKSREYLYRVICRRAPLTLDEHRAWHIPWELNLDAMQRAAAYFPGHHDFTSFRASICQSDSPVKTLDRLEVIQQGDEFHIHAAARSFLHHQVRNMTGAVVAAGSEKLNPDDIPDIFAARNRSAAPQTAPACGLYLMKVTY